MKNIAIIGSGAFGCALAYTFSKNNNVTMWSYTKEEADSINNKHECLLEPSIKLNHINCFLNIKDAINNSDIIVLVTPTYSIKEVCIKIKEYYNNQDIILASKGMDNDILFSNVIKDILGKEPSVIMGPSFAVEIGDDVPTYVELSGNKELINVLSSDSFRINYNQDSIGLQVAGALKNVITIAVGISEGLGYKVNTSSYIITEGLKEIKEIGISLGANESTFYGLAGIGDLYGTSLSNNSRNKRAGFLIAQNKKIEEIYEEVGQTIEGLDSLKDAKYIIDKYNLNCSLLNNLYNIVYNGKEKESIIL